MSLEQLVRLHTVLRDHLRGLSVEESLREQRRSHTDDEDLNKVSDEELKRRKAEMDVLFELNRRRKDEPDFVYDLEVEFPENSVRETCSWDQSDEEFSGVCGVVVQLQGLVWSFMYFWCIVSMWVSTEFFSFLPPPKNMPVGG